MRRLALAVALLASMPAAAQVAALPAETQAGLARLGPAMGPEAIAAAGTLLAPLMPAPAVTPERDLRYGPDPRHRLDVFSPGSGVRPVLVFVHGGGFVGGDKTRPGAHYYDNIGQWAAANGMVGVTITYRLAPAHPWPAVIEDIGAALAWVRANIATRGGDPARILLMGQSAGAAHVADTLAAHAANPGVAAAVLVSGVYDVASYPRAPTVGAYYGAEESVLAARSALTGLARLRIPVLVARAELEPQAFRDQAERLHAALCATQPECRPILDLPGHTHVSTVFAIGSPDRALTEAILAIAPR